MNPIQLVALGNAEPDFIDSLRAPLERRFHTRVATWPCTLDLEPFYDDQRAQYNSTAILLRLKEIAPGCIEDFPDGSRVLAFVNVDLFIPILTYVFGEAELGGTVAVVSSFRLQNERYGLPPDPRIFTERMLKEAAHELGHLYSLLHCTDQACVMHSSSSVEEVDLKGADFCPACAGQLPR